MSETDNQIVFIQEMKQCTVDVDEEVAHSQADKILVRFLRFIGYTALADEYEKVPKWYA